MSLTRERNHGAQLERDAMRTYLARRIAASVRAPESVALRTVLRWVHDRNRRVQQKAGGIGR
jgi:hypothetical protein